MSFGEIYRSVRDDGIPTHVIDLLPGSLDEAEFLRSRARRIAHELSRIALENASSFGWFNPTFTTESSVQSVHEPSTDGRTLAPVICLAKYRRASKELHL